MIINSDNKDVQGKETYSDALVFIAQANIAIYPDRLVQYSKNNKSISTINTTILSVKDNQSNDKVVCFKSDLAFKINQNKRTVSFIKIVNEKIELEFLVEKAAQMVVIQEILRRKLCEIGFDQKFKVIKQLGKGATAKVYLVQRLSDHRLFAAKVISIKQASNKDYETFTNETKIIKALKNPYIMAIQSLYISKKQLICVIQYLQGGTLLEQLKNDLIKTDRQKFKAISDIAQGLEHLRQKRIVHRDLKLENIMVRINKDKSKDYVIADFGLSCWIGEKQLLYEKCGTPGYIAPQILRASKGKIIVSHISDIFSFGVICHFIFLLKAVFPYNGNAKQLLSLNKKAVFSLQTKYHYTLMPSELQILRRTLELDVEKRVSSDQLLKVYIKSYQKQVIFEEKRRGRVNSAHIKQENEGVKRNHRIHLTNSIEMIQKRVPSMDKQQFSNRMKTEGNKSQKQPRENSFSKIFKAGKAVLNRITRSSTEVLKKKQQPLERKNHMKDFLK